MCGRRWGKSVVAQNIGVDYMLAGKKVAYLTPTYKLAKLFFANFETILPAGPGLFKLNKSDLLIELPSNKGILRFFTGEALDAFRGFDFDIVLVDEASYIPGLLDAWNQSIRPTLTDRKGRGIFLSTPRGRNDFYKISLNEMKSPEWKTFTFTSYDNPHIPAEEIDAVKLEIPEANFLQEYMASPMDNADNPFGSKFIRSCIKPISKKPPRVFGIDLAKSYDYTVIIGLDEDCNVCHFERFQKSWKETIEKINGLPDMPMLIDATGVGDPISEALQDTRSNVEGFKFTSLSKQDIILGLVTAVQQNNVGFPEGVIVSEMENFEYKITPTGVRYSAPTGLHDDTVAALALARKHWIKYGTYAKYHLL